MHSSDDLTRRKLLGHCLAAASGACALAAGAKVLGPASVQAEEPKDAEAEMPYGMIGDVKISRLMLGGNLVTGCMHCRDLRYVAPLFRAYMTEQKIF